MPANAPEELLLGFETSDDAAIYKIDNNTAAVLTLDFFTPVVDDPYEFGAIAAANALSDVFAMGAKPLTALNIFAFPCSLGAEVAGEVLRGGADKVREAGAFVVGGHSIDDEEPKYGLSVFGIVHPESIIRNEGACVGDVLYYTKCLGTGIMGAAYRAGLIDEGKLRPVINSMMELNKAGSQAMAQVTVHAATDVTGFGLAGHLHEMLASSGVSAQLEIAALPLFDDVLSLSADYCRPGKTFDLIDWAEDFIVQNTLPDEDFNTLMGVLCDPQTSGGLLIALPEKEATTFENAFKSITNRQPARIGHITKGNTGTITLY